MEAVSCAGCVGEAGATGSAGLAKPEVVAKVEPLDGAWSLLPVVVGCWSVWRLWLAAAGGMVASKVRFATAEWREKM